MKKKVYLVWTGRGEDAEFEGVYPNLIKATLRMDVLEARGYEPWRTERIVDLDGLEQLLEDEADEETWGTWI